MAVHSVFFGTRTD